MTPYYEAPNVTIYCGDARELIEQLDTPIAALITDPPYINVSLFGDQARDQTVDLHVEAVWYESVLSWYLRWMPACVERLGDGAGWIFADARYVPVILRAMMIAGWPLRGLYACQTTEVLMQVAGAAHVGDRPIEALMRTVNQYGQNKSAAILDVMLACCPKREGVLLDPFMGQGSTLVAGLKAGWPVVGIEQDEATCARAVEAIREVCV